MTIINIDKTNFSKVQHIYQQGILSGAATFETEVPDWHYWDINHLPYGRIIAKNKTHFLGWAALSAVSKRKVYAGVAEVSVYVDAQFRGQNVGDFLLKKLIEISEKNNIWTLQSGIMRANTPSLKLHKNNDFRIIGYKEKIGQLNGIWLDNIILERRSHTVGL
ncbi:N-acetyltransferase [Olleya sp. HaHaR_3_96]|nr:GNAT family N-acetyltransferase [Olleya sp. HaHaR_3_96]QXP58202.1 N-acetyltransferase [Olleya sp. HaHaR_3_96]